MPRYRGEYDHWLTKEQAAERLGTTIKQVQNLIYSGRIEAQTRPRAGARSISVISPESIEAEEQRRTDRATSILPPREAPSTVPASRNDEAQARFLALLDGLMKRLEAMPLLPAVKEQEEKEPEKKEEEQVPIHHKAVVTMKEAEALGFRRDRLTEAVREGKLENVGSRIYRFRRRDLDTL